MSTKLQLQKDFAVIFDAVLKTSITNCKYDRALTVLFSKMQFEQFSKQFMLGLDIVFRYPIVNRDVNVDRFIDFMASFVVNIAMKHEFESRDHDYSEETFTHPFLCHILTEVIKYNNINNVKARYNSSLFLSTLFKNLGSNIQLEDDICDKVTSAMMLRCEDRTPQIRRLAILTLARLQDPHTDCAVVKTFLDKITDPVSMVRKEVVLNLALNQTTILKIIERLRDVEASVRSAAFYKCSLISPKYIRIVDRQEVLNNGFNEENAIVRRTFQEKLLPKWLAFYDNNILKLLQAIKLDADDIDLNKSISLSEKLLEVLFKKQPINSLINMLELQDKVIPIEKLTIENVIFWSNFYIYVQNTSSLHEYLDDIYPEIMQIITYIESYIKVNETKRMMPFEKLAYQKIIYHLFKMVEVSDLSDEATRISLKKLISNLLSTYQFEEAVILEMMIVLEKISNNDLIFTDNICDIVSNIRDRELDLLHNQITSEKAEHDSKIAENKEKLLKFREQLETAIEEHNWSLASDIQKQVEEVKKTISDAEKLEQQKRSETCCRDQNTDPKIIIWSLNVIIALLKVPNIIHMNNKLEILKKEIIDPLLSSQDPEIYYKVFQCVCLYSIIDKKIAEENIRFLLSPILTYRLTAVCARPVLTASINAISDILRKFGEDILPKDDHAFKACSNKRRKLYHMGSEMEMEKIPFSLEQIIESMFDMLEDNNDEIKEVSAHALSYLTLHNFISTPSLISKLLVKWLNPVYEENYPQISQRFGKTLFMLAEKSSKEDNIFGEAVIPTLETIANAPKKNSLHEISQDKVITILANLISIETKQSIPVSIHSKICHHITKTNSEKTVNLLGKFLLALDFSTEDVEGLKQFRSDMNNLIKEVKESNIVRKLIKFKSKVHDKLYELEKGDLGSVSSTSGSYQLSEDESSGYSSEQQRHLSVDSEGTSDISLSIGRVQSRSSSAISDIDNKKENISETTNLQLEESENGASCKALKDTTQELLVKEAESLYKRVLRQNEHNKNKQKTTKDRSKPAIPKETELPAKRQKLSVVDKSKLSEKKEVENSIKILRSRSKSVSENAKKKKENICKDSNEVKMLPVVQLTKLNLLPKIRTSVRVKTPSQKIRDIQDSYNDKQNVTGIVKTLLNSVYNNNYKISSKELERNPKKSEKEKNQASRVKLEKKKYNKKVVPSTKKRSRKVPDVQNIQKQIKGNSNNKTSNTVRTIRIEDKIRARRKSTIS